MSRLYKHPRALLAVAGGMALAALTAVAWRAGLDAVGDAFTHVDPIWLGLAAGGQLVAYAGYVLTYRAIARLEGGPELPLGLVARLVSAGFGAHLLRGGFALDMRALRGVSGEHRRSVTRVLGLGALEWALLAPAACLAAIALLIVGSHVENAMLWSWAVGVPVGFAIGLWAASPRRVRKLEGARGWKGALYHALAGVAVLRELAARPWRWAGAWIGMAVYWTGDVASFYGALRTFDLHLGLGVVVVAYATGYAATRRTLPLGGAGVTEALMSFAVRWVGVPLAAAVPVVAVYRLASFVLPTAPALAVHGSIDPFLRQGDLVASGGGVKRSGERELVD